MPEQPPNLPEENRPRPPIPPDTLPEFSETPPEPPTLPEMNRKPQVLLDSGAQADTLTLEEVHKWLGEDNDVLVYEMNSAVATLYKDAAALFGLSQERLKFDEIVHKLKGSERPAAFFIMDLNVSGTNNPNTTPVSQELATGIQRLKQAIEAIQQRQLKPGEERTKILLTKARDKDEVVRELSKQGIPITKLGQEETLTDPDEVPIYLLEKPDLISDLINHLAQTIKMNKVDS